MTKHRKDQSKKIHTGGRRKFQMFQPLGVNKRRCPPTLAPLPLTQYYLMFSESISSGGHERDLPSQTQDAKTRETTILETSRPLM